MANKKKFENPVKICPQIEAKDKDLIDQYYDNQTTFINEAIREKLERDGHK